MKIQNKNKGGGDGVTSHAVYMGCTKVALNLQTMRRKVSFLYFADSRRPCVN